MNSAAEIQYPLIRPVLPAPRRLLSLFEKSLQSRIVTKGPLVEEFENAAADYLGVKHALAMSSATVALALTLAVVRESYKSVYLPSFTFMATGGAAAWAGLKMRFVDVLEQDGNVNPSGFLPDSESAILAVHNYGNPADVRSLSEIALSARVPLIIDAAHAFGARIDGVPAGGQGLASVFSLSPTKILIAGEGGLVSTNDSALAHELAVLREYGNSGSYSIDTIAGLNGRMSEFHAAIALLGIETVDDHVRVRNEVADYYATRFRNIPGIRVPVVSTQNVSTFKDYTLFVDPSKRARLAVFLRERGVGSRSYWDPPLHAQPAFSAAAGSARLPVTHRLASSSISIPIWSDMEPREAEFIAGAVEQFFQDAKRADLGRE